MSIEPGPAGSHGLSLSAAQLRKLSRATDTLSVAWLREGFGRMMLAKPAKNGKKTATVTLSLCMGWEVREG